MECYKTLHKSSQKTMMTSIASVVILLAHTIYCIVVKSLGSSWLPIPIVVLNLLFITWLLFRIWYVIYSNDTSSVVYPYFLGIMIFSYFFGCCLCIYIYMVNLFIQNTVLFLPQEFIIVVPYFFVLAIMLVGGICLICYGMYLVFYWFYTMIINTYAVVNERCKYVNTKPESSNNSLHSVVYDPVPS